MLVQNTQVTKISKSKSFNGYEFDLNSNIWQLDKNKQLDTFFISKFHHEIQDDLIGTLAYFAETKSAYHAVNMAVSLKSYYDKTQNNLIDEKGLLKYKSIYSRKNEEHRLGTLRVFLKQIYYLEYEAVSEQVFELLNGWKLAGNDKGQAVLSLDPEEGPYSDLEFEAIKAGLDNKYAESVISLEEYVIAQLFACTGRRPIQIASLKIGDLDIDSQLLDKSIFVLSVPRAKVRGGKFRGKFRKFALEEYVGQVIRLHIAQLKTVTEQILGRSLTNKQINLIPLFPDNLFELKHLSAKELELCLETDVMHITTSELTSRLRNVVDKLKITSERTGKNLYTTGYRFRYTLGTRAAREGAGIITIAQLLDQSDTQNTKVYVANIPEHAATISVIMNGSLIRYANAFLGEVVLDESDALNKVPNAPRIRSFDSKSNLGSCGTCNDCHQFAPVACYVCPKFKPWRDAPHEVILKWLLDERERIKNVTGDIEIAAINDRAIVAVNQVIMRCAELKEDPQYD